MHRKYSNKRNFIFGFSKSKKKPSFQLEHKLVYYVLCFRMSFHFYWFQNFTNEEMDSTKIAKLKIITKIATKLSSIKLKAFHAAWVSNQHVNPFCGSCSWVFFFSLAIFFFETLFVDYKMWKANNSYWGRKTKKKWTNKFYALWMWFFSTIWELERMKKTSRALFIHMRC